MATRRRILRTLGAGALLLAGLGLTAAPAGSTNETRRVSATVPVSCSGPYSFETTVEVSASVARVVRAERSFAAITDVGVTVDYPGEVAGYMVDLGVSGGSPDRISVGPGAAGRAYLAAHYDSGRPLALTVAGLTIADPSVGASTCTAAEPVPLATIQVRPKGPYSTAPITASQPVTMYCERFPRGYPEFHTLGVGVTLPGSVRSGSTFSIRAGAGFGTASYSVVGATPGEVSVTPLSPETQTFTATAPPGGTVQVWFGTTTDLPTPTWPEPTLFCGGNAFLAAIPVR